MLKTCAKQLSCTIGHHVKHHGVEWTVSLLKDMKTRYVNHISSNRLGWDSNPPKGSFKPVWSLPVKDALQVLNIYSCEKLQDISERQANKFLDAVKAADSEVVRLQTANVIPKIGVSVYNHLRWKHPYGWIRSPKKRTPFIREDLGICSVEETQLDFHDVLMQIGRSDEQSKDLVKRFGALYARALWVPIRTIMGAIAGPCRDIFDHGPIYQSTLRRPVVGSLGYIQERGCKLRVVANAFRHHQMALGPLGDLVYGILRELRWDCTFDQQKGQEFIQNSLSQGKIVFCYDLSNATDRFPLSVQVHLMEDVIEHLEKTDKAEPSGIVQKGNRDIDEATVTVKDLRDGLNLFKSLARGLWYAPLLGVHNQNDYVRWTRGQPLGLYPSFGIFALTHGNMVRAIERGLGLSDTFRVLGDDIVINNPEVAEHYREMMDTFECEISEAKSVISDLCGEFAGKILTKDDDITPLKWSNFNIGSPFRPVEILGKDGYRFLPGKYRKPIKRFVALPEPVGLGLNPDGLSLDNRLDYDTLKWYWPTRYKLLTNNDLTFDDKQHHTEVIYNALYSPKSIPDLWRCIVPPRDQRSGDSSLITFNLKREHFNAIVKGLDPWAELPPLVEHPVSDQAPSRGDVRSKMGMESSILTRVFSYLRNSRRAHL
jgi:hypothetical protein